MRTHFFTLLLITSFFSFADSESVCGPDNRKPYQDMRIGRLEKADRSASCTVTLIGKSCVLSAGHCRPDVEKLVAFDVPPSKNGVLQPSRPENNYEIDHSFIRSMDHVWGNDWMVLKLKANKITGKLPGEVNGFYSISQDAPTAGEEIFIAGYGIDLRGDKSRHATLQIDRGRISSIKENAFGFKEISYSIDTEGGNSGSAIIRERTSEIVGIHTNGGECQGSDLNFGTIVGATKKLRTAISDCLAE